MALTNAERQAKYRAENPEKTRRAALERYYRSKARKTIESTPAVALTNREAPDLGAIEQ